MTQILWAIIAVLVVLWLLGLVLSVFGDLVWWALVIAAVLFVVNMFLGRRTRV